MSCSDPVPGRGSTWKGKLGSFAMTMGSVTEFDARVHQMLEQREKWQAYFEDQGLGVVQFKETSRAPHILSVQVNADAEDFLMMNATQFAASTGSACNASLMEVSHVLKAIGNESGNVIRMSV